MNRSPMTVMAMAAGLAFSTYVAADTMSPGDYNAGLERIESQYKTDRKNCEALSGNTLDICVAEAIGQEKTAKANLAATHKNTRQARHDALVVKAKADYSVAIERCDDKAGNAKDVCVKEAKAAETIAISDAKAQLKTSSARATADKKSAAAQSEASRESSIAEQDAATNKGNAEHAVAMEKCEALAGNAKMNCVSEARMHHGMK